MRRITKRFGGPTIVIDDGSHRPPHIKKSFRILFPMLAVAHKAKDGAAVARFVANGVRVAVLLAGLMVSVTSGLSGSSVRRNRARLAGQRRLPGDSLSQAVAANWSDWANAFNPR